MDGRPTDGVGVVDVPTKEFPSIQAVHSQDAMVADLLQQAAEAGGVVEGQAGVVVEQGSHSFHMEFYRLAVKKNKKKNSIDL